MAWTSTLPGPMYATPRFSGMSVLPPSRVDRGRVELLDCGGACRRDRVVVLDRRAGDPDRADHHVAVLDRDPTRERDQSVVGMLDVVEGASRRGEAPDVAGV